MPVSAREQVCLTDLNISDLLPRLKSETGDRADVRFFEHRSERRDGIGGLTDESDASGLRGAGWNGSMIFPNPSRTVRERRSSSVMLAAVMLAALASLTML